MREPWRLVGQVVSTWARANDERAVANARAAAVVCSRIAVERAEVALHLEVVAAARAAAPAVTATTSSYAAGR